MKVKLDYEGIKRLLELAKQGETVDHWIALALNWMEQAEAEIVRLTKCSEGHNGTTDEH